MAKGLESEPPVPAPGQSQVAPRAPGSGLGQASHMTVHGRGCLLCPQTPLGVQRMLPGGTGGLSITVWFAEIQLPYPTWPDPKPY
jgi:hypothetical protein